jgi:hypothetical protein
MSLARCGQHLTAIGSGLGRWIVGPHKLVQRWGKPVLAARRFGWSPVDLGWSTVMTLGPFSASMHRIVIPIVVWFGCGRADLTSYRSSTHVSVCHQHGAAPLARPLLPAPRRRAGGQRQHRRSGADARRGGRRCGSRGRTALSAGECLSVCLASRASRSICPSCGLGESLARGARACRKPKKNPNRVSEEAARRRCASLLRVEFQKVWRCLSV